MQMFAAWLTFVRRHWLWLVALNMLSLSWWFFSQGVTAEAQVAYRTEHLRKALAAKSSDRFYTFLSDEYSDQWGLSGDELRLAVRDVNAQFFDLKVEWENPALTVADNTAVLRARPKLDGRALSPVGDFMLREARKFQEPFEFHWQKEGIWPWSWKIVRIAQPDLELPRGYRPGILSEPMEGQGLNLQQLLNR